MSGQVKDKKGNPVPYAHISIGDGKHGIVTDKEGFFFIEVPHGKYEIEVYGLNHELFRDTMEIRGVNVKDFVLRKMGSFFDLTMEQVEREDSARQIIEKAIRAKRKNRLPFSSLRYEAYTKTTLRFPPYYPFDSLLTTALTPFMSKKKRAEGKKVKRPAWLPPELDSDILYLSENLSEVNYEAPNKVKERIIHSRVSGDLTRFNFMGNLVTRFDIYDNRTIIRAVAERGLISPLADRAHNFYDYYLEDVYGEGEDRIFKIKVIPKRRFDPVFHGHLYLADSTWEIRQVDLYATKDQSLDLLDTLKVKQVFMPVEGHWVPFRSTMHVNFSFNLVFLKVPFTGEVTSLLSDYNPMISYPKRYFNRELLIVEAHTSDESRAVFDSIRPVPLSPLEREDYRLKDSLRSMRTSQAYEDSVRKVKNRLTAANFILLGQTFQGRGRLKSINVEQLLSSVGFNPMEGWFVRPHLAINWDLNYDRSLLLDAQVRYGFSNSKFSYAFKAIYKTRPKFDEHIMLAGGDYISEFSRFSQIGFYPNTESSLLYKNSRMRLYRKVFVEAGYRRELLNGFTFDGNVRYEDRSEMPNTSDFSFFNKDKTFAPNFSLESHGALIAEVNLNFQPFNDYITSPTTKINIGSVWPLVSFSYQQAFPVTGSGAADFAKVKLSLSKDFAFGILGSNQWRVTVGRFIHNRTTYFPDYFHFKSNETFSRPAQHDAFFLSKYYEHSTTNAFLEAHFEHDFSGFLFNKIPFVRGLKIREFLGAHLLSREGFIPYLEGNFGLEKVLFKFFSVRLDLYFSVTSETGPRYPAIKFLPPSILINITK